MKDDRLHLYTGFRIKVTVTSQETEDGNHVMYEDERFAAVGSKLLRPWKLVSEEAVSSATPIKHHGSTIVREKAPSTPYVLRIIQLKCLVGSLRGR